MLSLVKDVTPVRTAICAVCKGMKQEHKACRCGGTVNLDQQEHKFYRAYWQPKKRRAISASQPGLFDSGIAAGGSSL